MLSASAMAADAPVVNNRRENIPWLLGSIDAIGIHTERERWMLCQDSYVYPSPLVQIYMPLL